MKTFKNKVMSLSLALFTFGIALNSFQLNAFDYCKSNPYKNNKACVIQCPGQVECNGEGNDCYGAGNDENSLEKK